MSDPVGVRAAWITRGGAIRAAFIGGVFLLTAAVLTIWYGKSSGSKPTINASTSGDRSPQYIGGDNSTFNVDHAGNSLIPEDIQRILSDKKIPLSGYAQKYPLGWVFFRYDSRGELLPFTFGELKCDADWERAKPQLDNQQKTFSFHLPPLLWNTSNLINTTDHANYPQVGSYEIGKPIELKTAANLPGKPRPHLEIVDDTPRAPVYVIGFKR